MPRKPRSIPKIKRRAGELRKESTPAETKLWDYLRGNRLGGISFRRQHAIGKYITDFCSPRKKLVIELDGSQHGGDLDEERTTFLRKQGYRVLRFWNDQILNEMEVVMRSIRQALEE
jgi:very-short-patch-repair endonuclease